MRCEGERLAGGPVCKTFGKRTISATYLMQYLMLITMRSLKLAFSRKNTPARICGKIITSEVKEQNVKIILNVIQRDVK